MEEDQDLDIYYHYLEVNILKMENEELDLLIEININ
jgi:hypothetical protein